MILANDFGDRALNNPFCYTKAQNGVAILGF